MGEGEGEGGDVSQQNYGQHARGESIASCDGTLHACSFRREPATMPRCSGDSTLQPQSPYFISAAQARFAHCCSPPPTTSHIAVRWLCRRSPPVTRWLGRLHAPQGWIVEAAATFDEGRSPVTSLALMPAAAEAAACAVACTADVRPLPFSPLVPFLPLSFALPPSLFPPPPTPPRSSPRPTPQRRAVRSASSYHS